jgi:hypothetical protein
MNDSKEQPQPEQHIHSTDPVEPGRPDVMPVREAVEKSHRGRGLTPPDYDEYGSEPEQEEGRQGTP